MHKGGDEPSTVFVKGRLRRKGLALGADSPGTEPPVSFFCVLDTSLLGSGAFIPTER